MDPPRDAAPTGLSDPRLVLALDALHLKDEPRRGWVLRGVRGPESVAAHAWGTTWLCLLFAEEAGVDVGTALAIATVHDLAEARTGDVAARADAADRTVSEAAKAASERRAIEHMLGRGHPRTRALWQAYEDRASAEARFVRDMNLLDMCLQALAYQLQGRYDPDTALPSRAGYRALDEFFASAEPRLTTALARRAFEELRRAYVRAAGDPERG